MFTMKGCITMTKEELLKFGVTADIAEKIVSAQMKELDGSYVPKGRFNELNESNKSLKELIANRDTQLEELKKSVGDSEGLRKQIADLQTANKKALEDHAKEIANIRIDNAIETGLRIAKARNVKAVRALLDMDSLEYDSEKGKLKGLTKQIQKLQESEDSKFLFDTPANPDNGKPSIGIHSNANEPSSQPTGNGISLGEQMAAMFNSEHAPSESGATE